MNTTNKSDNAGAERDDIFRVDGRELRCLANLVDGICRDEHFRWITTSPGDKPHHGDHTHAMAEALREAGAPLCEHDLTKEITSDMHFVFSDLATGSLVIMTMFGPGGSNWIDVPTGSEAEAHIKAALDALPKSAKGGDDKASPKHVSASQPTKPTLQ